YVYGDLCTGEIFSFDGSTSSLLLATGTSIHSFGEDEGGEIYMVDGGGTISRIVPAMSCSNLTINPQSQSMIPSGGPRHITISDPGGCFWSSASNASWITIQSGGSGSTGGTLNYMVSANSTSSPRVGTISVAGTAFKITQGTTLHNFQGFLDGAGCNVIAGWAWDGDDPNSTTSVDIYDGNTLIATAPAGMYREDLLNVLGSPYHGFSFPTPVALKDSAIHSISVKIAGTGILLGGGPKGLKCGGSTN